MNKTECLKEIETNFDFINTNLGEDGKYPMILKTLKTIQDLVSFFHSKGW